MSEKKKQARFNISNMANIATHFTLTGVSLVALFPFFWIVMTAFKEKKDAFSMPPTWFFKPTLKNFISVFQGDFLQSLFNSILISIIVTLLTIIIGIFAAYSFSRYDIKGKKHFFFFVLSTRMGPPVAFALHQTPRLWYNQGLRTTR